MILGKTQTLVVDRKTSVGVFLSDPGQEKTGRKEEAVLLPKKYVTDSMTVGSEVDVFVLRDSEDRLIATTRHPKAQVGDLAVLHVVDVARAGAFLDWGLEKDLLLPYGEQLRHLRKGDWVLVHVQVDRSGRIVATMRVREAFAKPGAHRENDRVQGVVYAVNPDIGAFVLVEGRYNGLISKEQQQGALRVAQEVSCRIANIKPDGKLDLSMFSRMHEELDKDAGTIWQMLRDNGGFLRVNDRSDPEVIRQIFGMSKAQFKRSVGRLLKQGKIAFADGGIRQTGGKR